MLYLKSLVLDRFKSFKHTELLFSKGFTCVVGPNGSGKSNIFDALLFGFGETSLQRLRVDNLSGLIDTSLKKKDDFSRAYIRMELGGDENISITKIIRSDGKSGYKVNGKHMTRREVLDYVNRYGLRADETTTIAQGEINQIIKLNPKERRELIDIAAGIKEFEYKKQEAMRELEKVDQKIAEANVMLSERSGFLKELEKEKEAAELYVKMTSRLKNLKYSILVSRKTDLQSQFDSSTSEMAVLDSKINEQSYKADELAKRIEQLNNERQQLTKELNESTSSMSEISKRLELINKEHATLEAKINGHREMLKSNDELIVNLKSDLNSTKTKISENKKLLDESKKELVALEKELEEMNSELESGELDKKITTLNEKISDLGSRVIDIQSYISKLQADISLTEKEESDSKKLLEESRTAIEKKRSLIKEKEERRKEIQNKENLLQREGAELESSIISSNKEIGQIEEKLIEFMQQRAIAQSRENTLTSKISDQFGSGDGFYGRASQLCTYNNEYSIAVETGAGSRFDYFVVDSISTANKIINYLKKNNLGRATFIPMKELNVEKSQKNESLTHLIELVKFEDRFKKVFDYVFSNTYLIESIEKAKETGIGRARYVTKTGELVEQSGIVSGGSQKKVSLASIENNIKELTERKLTLKSKVELENSKLAEKRRGAASLEIELRSISGEIQRMSDELLTIEKNLNNYSDVIEELPGKRSKIEKELLSRDKEKLETVDLLTASKSELNSLYNKSMALSKKHSRSSKSSEAEKLNSLVKRVEELKIKTAELNKENELLEKKSEELVQQQKEKNTLSKDLTNSIKDKEIRLEILSKSKSEIDQEVKNSGTSSKKAYERLDSIDSNITKLSSDHGRIKAEIDNLNRQLNDIKVKRSQSETRLNDITVELATYTGSIELVKVKIEEMEGEANLLTAKITDLGNVNLKAPEIFDEKKKDVEEALSKVNTLAVEKQAVIRMMEDIDSKKLQTFMYTFNEVNRNFTKLYNYIFPDMAKIVLEDDKDPLNSGLDISIKNGKAEKSLNAMSGGEKSFVSLVLLFAIHTFKPSSLYIFDEVDSALDKENSKKLSLLIKQMSKDAQFVVVSHNDSLIVNADTAIGVVKTNNESKAVGLDVSTIANKQ